MSRRSANSEQLRDTFGGTSHGERRRLLQDFIDRQSQAVGRTQDWGHSGINRDPENVNV